MVSSALERNKVFISYSHKDAKYLDGLLPHLQYLEKNKRIDLWVDTKLKPGENWQNEIENALASAKVAILLISIDFLNSPFIEKNELLPLLSAAEAEGVTILPVILRPSGELPKGLSHFQAINSPSRTLSRMKGYEREELWVKVANATADAMSSYTSMEKKVHKEALLNEETDDYDEELEEALQEFRQRPSLDPTLVLSKQGKVGEEEEYD